MRLEVSTHLNLRKAMGFVILCMVVVLAGCDCGQRSTGMVVKPSSEVESVQSAYDARISSQVGQPVRSVSQEYSQVSMFGDLTKTSRVSEVQSSQSLQQHTFATEGACFDPKISSDGKWLAFASTQHTLKPDIYIKQVNSVTMTQLTNHPASDVQPVFSSDSRKIAFCSDRTGNWDIFIVDGNGRNLQQVTDDPAPEMHPSFSIDGKKLVYSRYNGQSRQWEIWLLDLSNPGQRKYIAAGLFPNFSPVGHSIVYQRPAQRGSELFGIWMISLGKDDQPSMPTEVISGSDRALIGPEWSSDGEKIVYCSVHPNDKGAAVDSQLWIVGVNGRGRMPITDQGIGCFSPVWGPDSKVYFCANRGECENIWSVVPMIAGEEIATAKAGESIKPNSPIQLDARATVEVGEE